jgi:phosphatidylglycerol:prolipoprotein diacylglycerol transferase
MLELIPFTPDPVALRLGPLTVHWYGIGYAVGLALAYVVMVREARRRGLDPGVVDQGIVVVLVAGLIGGRAYHVVDQWSRYSHDLVAVVRPPYTGLGVLGGIVGGTLALVVLLRRRGESFWRWADVVAPGAFVMQAVARWGNFFNQELYGPPTDLPWGVRIDCAHRVAPWSCGTYPEATTGFQPLFLHESLSGVLGAVVVLVVARRWGDRLRPGDLFLGWLIWYSLVRLGLETMRSGNWTAFDGVPTATVVTLVFVAGALVALGVRHRPGRAADRTPDQERSDSAV